MAESHALDKHDLGSTRVMASGLQLSLKAHPASSMTPDDALKLREEALNLREELLDSRERDLDRREVQLRLRESTLGSSSGAVLRKLPCDVCNVQGRVCGRSEPCYDLDGYCLHHHHTCQACHDARRAQKRAPQCSCVLVWI